MLFWIILLILAVGWLIYLVYINVRAYANKDSNEFIQRSERNKEAARLAGIEVPKMKKWQTDTSASNLIVQKIQESSNILQTTTNPQIFFERLNICFDLLLEHMTYRAIFFKGFTPEDNYIELQLIMEKLVDDMVTRCYNKAQEDALKLKTEKGRVNRIIKCFETLDII